MIAKNTNIIRYARECQNYIKAYENGLLKNADYNINNCIEGTYNDIKLWFSRDLWAWEVGTDRVRKVVAWTSRDRWKVMCEDGKIKMMRTDKKDENSRYFYRMEKTLWRLSKSEKELIF